MKCSLCGLLLAVLAFFTACGSTSNNHQNNVNVNGNWSASLADGGGTQVFTFTTTLVESSGGSVSGQSLTFTSNSACFVDGGTETGAFTVSGDTNGVTSAGVQLTIVSTGSSAGNTLTLNGTFQNNTIQGTWTLNGGLGCSGTGTFQMTRVS
jgi:hypothetical protein